MIALSVCLLPGYLKKLLTDLKQILWNDRPLAKDQSVRGRGAWIQDGFFHFFNLLGIKYDYSDLSINVHEILGRIGLQIRNIRLDFGTQLQDQFLYSFSTFPALREREREREHFVVALSRITRQVVSEY